MLAVDPSAGFGLRWARGRRRGLDRVRSVYLALADGRRRAKIFLWNAATRETMGIDTPDLSVEGTAWSPDENTCSWWALEDPGLSPEPDPALHSARRRGVTRNVMDGGWTAAPAQRTLRRCGLSAMMQRSDVIRSLALLILAVFGMGCSLRDSLENVVRMPRAGPRLQARARAWPGAASPGAAGTGARLPVAGVSPNAPNPICTERERACSGVLRRCLDLGAALWKLQPHTGSAKCA